MSEGEYTEGQDQPITGSVKWFNVAKGFGFITRDDAKGDVFVHQSAIKSKGYRSLEEGEKVKFKTVSSDKGTIAVYVTSPDGGNIRRLSRKCRVKKGARKYTSLCYNCNTNGHRMKNCPIARRVERTCHKCGSQNHLIRTCPRLLEQLSELRADQRREGHDVFNGREFLPFDWAKEPEDHSWVSWKILTFLLQENQPEIKQGGDSNRMSMFLSLFFLLQSSWTRHVHINDVFPSEIF